ncbi:MAG: four helix bundle protein [Armatimonadetes bacterium]|nr:MAG: four helix bundle protein [Armatimonadota bacterium]
MNKLQTTKYNLEDRTLEFAKAVIRLCSKLPKNAVSINSISQIIRSSSSVGANYREANDSLGKKDFIHRLRISRKEAKETLYWIHLLKEANPNIDLSLIEKECTELRNILSAIIIKVSNKV